MLLINNTTLNDDSIEFIWLEASFAFEYCIHKMFVESSNCKHSSLAVAPNATSTFGIWLTQNRFSQSVG